MVETFRGRFLGLKITTLAITTGILYDRDSKSITSGSGMGLD